MMKNVKFNRMKKYYSHLLAFAFTINVLAVTGQDTVKMFTVPGSVFLDIHAAPSITNFSNSNYKDNVSMKSGFIGGLDIAYYFMNIKTVHIGMSLGLNYSYYRSGLKSNYNDSLWTTDVDNENVYLYEKGNNLKETQKVHYIDIPVLLHFDCPVSTKLSLYCLVGMFYSIIASQTYESSVQYTAEGYYPKYNATLYNIDISNSPYHYPTNKQLSNSGKLNLKNNVGGQFTLGCKYSVTPLLAVTAGLSLLQGIKNIAGDKNSDETPLANSNYQIISLMSRSNNIRTTAYCLELGVSYKLSELRFKPSKSNTNSYPENIIQQNQSNNINIPSYTDKATNLNLIKDSFANVPPKVDSLQKDSLKISVFGTVLGKDEAELLFKSVNDTIKTVTKNGNYAVMLSAANYNVEIYKKGCIPMIQTLNLEHKKYGDSILIPELKVQNIEKGTMFKFDAIKFETGTNKLSTGAYAILDIIFKTIIDNPAINLSIQGHTDNIGKDELNQILSQNRAITVMDYLIKKGINPLQLKAIGYGSTKPIADNKSEEGRTLNRRVEFIVSDLN